MKTPENFEKMAVDRWLKEVGPDLVWHCKPYMAGFGKSGVPDYLLCLNGALWGLEIKRPGKDATDIQKRRMDAIRRAGGRAVAGTAEVVIQAMSDWLRTRGISVQ